jgi:hypothetical protein
MKMNKYQHRNPFTKSDLMKSIVSYSAVLTPRREYLAADKPKIYITVKLSSVTHACHGSDPDERPNFSTTAP